MPLSEAVAGKEFGYITARCVNSFEMPLSEAAAGYGSLALTTRMPPSEAMAGKEDLPGQQEWPVRSAWMRHGALLGVRALARATASDSSPLKGGWGVENPKP